MHWRLDPHRVYGNSAFATWLVRSLSRFLCLPTHRFLSRHDRITCICPHTALALHPYACRNRDVAVQAAVVLRAPGTAVSGSASKPLAEGAALAGGDIGLVVIVQARHARLVSAPLLPSGCDYASPGPCFHDSLPFSDYFGLPGAAALCRMCRPYRSCAPRSTSDTCTVGHCCAAGTQ